MRRRRLLQASAASSLMMLSGKHGYALAAQTPVASPEHLQPEDEPLDTRARELIDRLGQLRPLAVLEALETAEVTDPILLDAAGSATPTPKIWNDMGDTDLRHSLGGVLVVTNDETLNSPELAALGAYIVYESAEIAFADLQTMLEELDSGFSTTTAGTMVWLTDVEDMQLGVMRLGNVLVSAMTSIGTADMYLNVPEGMVMHLDAVTRSLM